jgi:hypothetical protein
MDDGFVLYVLAFRVLIVSPAFKNWIQPIQQALAMIDCVTMAVLWGIHPRTRVSS